MKFMSWSWRDLMEAPEDIVQEIIRILNEQAEQDEVQRLMQG